MATTNTRDLTREQIINDGYLKHRETGLVTRWRHRYVVFKISSTGRFVFTVYRDKPAVQSNELTIVPLDEFGGLDHTLKLDGEKHVFAIITTSVTECFAADSPDIVREWRTVLQEYLGKELVINIEVPYKQKFLKSGKAQMRIRNTGFTITSLDGPPKCLGTWMILHVRKFGGGDVFKFETGSKCPSGEYFYVIHSSEGKKIKEVFAALSHHKPIFEDDRTGRRMTQEQKLLRKMRERQQIGPKLSLQNNSTPVYSNTSHHRRPHRSLSKQEGVDQARLRSNALITEPDSQYSPLVSTTSRMRTSPSANDIFEGHGYQNLPEGGVPNTNQPVRKAQTLNSSTSPAHDTDNTYYNRDAIELQKHLMSKSRNDSGSESEDDFVDINNLTDESCISTYYNLQDNTLVKKAIMEHKSQPELPTYENYTPKHSKNSPRSADRHSDPNERLYTNLEIVPSKTDTAKDIVVPTVPELEDDNSENRVTEREPLPEHTEISKSTLSASSKSLTDSEGSDNSTFRNRTTSIVEHVMISADQSTRSCDDLLNVNHKLWSEDEVQHDGNHSDSEILHESSRARRKSSYKASDSGVGSDHEDYQPLSITCQRSPNRINEYDHLKLKHRRESKSSDGGEYIPLAGLLPQGHQDNKEQYTVEESLQLVKMPEDSTIMKSFQNRKQREHVYEDVNMLEEERCSSSASSESPSSTPKHENKQKSYQRKISLLGRRHCYEPVVLEKSPSPPPDSFTSKLRDHLLSPTRLSPARKNNTKQSRPLLQSSSANSSFDSEEVLNPMTSLPAPAVLANSRNSRKPVPTPRQIGRNTFPMESHHRTTTSPAHHSTGKESAYVNGSVILEQLNAVERPVLPPKPRKYSNQEPEYTLPYKSSLLHQTRSPERFASSDSFVSQRTVQPRIKTQPSLQEHLPNYTQIYVQTEPVLVSKDQSKLSQSRADRKYPVTEYTKIDHFQTEQLHHLIEQRNIEKRFAAC